MIKPLILRKIKTMNKKKSRRVMNVTSYSAESSIDVGRQLEPMSAMIISAVHANYLICQNNEDERAS